MKEMWNKNKYQKFLGKEKSAINWRVINLRHFSRFRFLVISDVVFVISNLFKWKDN